MHIDGDRRRRVLSLAKCLEELYAARQQLLLDLKDLDERTRAIQLEHDTLQNLDAPTSNLPDELLAMIFEAGAELEADSLSLKHTSFKTYLMDPYHSPTHFGDLASHVSRRWRSIALTTSRLWINIECTRIPDMGSPVGMQGRAGLERKGWMERATNHLRRSRSSPVNIYIRSLREEDYTFEFLQLLSDHMGHCRQLQILEIPTPVVPLLLAPLSRPAPLLSYFGASSEEDLNFEGPGFFPFGAPCLATADLHQVSPSLHPAFVSVTSLRLTDIWIASLDTNNYASLRDGLMGLNSLNHLEIQLANWHRPDTADEIMLRTVQFLHVDVTDADSACDIKFFLESIDAPSLISLSLNGWFTEDASIEFHFPSLQHLILLDLYMDEKDLDKLARQFPHINRLTSRALLDHRCGLDTILRVVLGQSRDQGQEDSESNGPPWSNLQTIAVADSSTPLNTALLGLVSRLKYTNHPLCRLLISNTAFDAADEGITEQLRVLVEIEDFTEDWPTPFERGR